MGNVAVAEELARQRRTRRALPAGRERKPEAEPDDEDQDDEDQDDKDEDDEEHQARGNAARLTETAGEADPPRPPYSGSG